MSLQEEVEVLLITEYDFLPEEATEAVEDFQKDHADVWEDDDLGSSDLAEIIAEAE